MSTLPTQASPLPLVHLCRGRAPLAVATAIVLVVGALGSLLLPLGVSTSEVYRAGTQLWTTAVALGYVVWFGLYVVERCRADLARLEPHLAVAPQTANPFAVNRHPRILWAFTAAGVAFGIAFNVLVGGVLGELLRGEDPTWLYAWGPPLLAALWGTVFHAFWILIDNARLLARIGEHELRIDLNDLGALDVFADAGTRHFLLLAGGLAVFPIQGILGQGMDLLDVLPGVMIVLPVALFLFVWPLLAARRAIQHARAAELRAIDAQLQEAPRLGDRYLLLSIHRGQVSALPAWPLRLRSLARLALYLVIPPLAWVAAALVDTVVSRHV